MNAYAASSEIVPLLESLTGMLSLIETKYGGVGQMIEGPEWDESKTDYSYRLVRTLRSRIATLEREFHEHVDQKPDQDV